MRIFWIVLCGASVPFGTSSTCFGTSLYIGPIHAYTLWILFGVNTIFRRGFLRRGDLLGRAFRDEYFLGRDPRQVTERGQVEENKGR